MAALIDLMGRRFGAQDQISNPSRDLAAPLIGIALICVESVDRREHSPLGGHPNRVGLLAANLPAE
eukprot:4573261-Pyramimonas_sp.AAC.1